MQLHIPAKTLKDALQIVAKAAPSRSRLPILDCCLIEATSDNTVTLSATDLEMFTRTQVAAQVQTPGAATVPIKELGIWLQAIAAGTTVTLTTDGTTVQATGGGYRTTLTGQPVADYPTLALPSAPPVVSIPVAVLREMIPQVLFAAAQDAADRPALAGVLWRWEGRTLTLVAGDGHRLAVRRAGCLGRASGQASQMNIPAKAMRELGRVLATRSGATVQIHRHPTTDAILFVAGRVTLGTQVLERFPNWESTIPTNAATHSLTATGALLQAVESVKPSHPTDLHMVYLTMTPADAGAPGSVTVASEIAGTERKSTVQIPAHITGPGGSVAFNGRYLREVLRAMPSAQVEIDTDSNGQAGLFRPAQMGELLHIIMPMSKAA
ncbi:MAG: DNA polymerase III subunit beta [Chloroflexota bacterium]|nr:DNA polymerase III subunit beta [Chloroflexota bacterium]